MRPRGIRTCACSLADEPVALAVDRHDVGRLFRVRFEFLPQPEDVRIYRACRGELIIAPHFIQQPISGQDLAAVLHEAAEELKLLAREPNLAAGLEGLAGTQVQAYIPEREGLELLARARSPKDSADPGEELPQAKGFGHVVVRSHLEPAHLVHLLTARREHDDRNVQALLPEGPAHVPPAQA